MAPQVLNHHFYAAHIAQSPGETWTGSRLDWLRSSQDCFCQSHQSTHFNISEPPRECPPPYKLFVVKYAISFWFINSNLKTTLIPDYEKFLPLNLVFLHSLHSLTQARKFRRIMLDFFCLFARIIIRPRWMHKMHGRHKAGGQAGQCSPNSKNFPWENSGVKARVWGACLCWLAPRTSQGSSRAQNSSHEFHPNEDLRGMRIEVGPEDW